MKTYGEPVLRLGFLNLEHDGGPEEKPFMLPERWVVAQGGEDEWVRSDPHGCFCTRGSSTALEIGRAHV